MPRLARINVYPIKSCDGVTVTSSRFVAGGGLQFDRRFALFTERFELINGKKFPAIHRLRSDFSPDFAEVTLTAPDGAPQSFAMAAGNADLDAYLTQYFGQPVRVMENAETGFMDDLASPGPTVLAAATLDAAASRRVARRTRSWSAPEIRQYSPTSISENGSVTASRPVA